MWKFQGEDGTLYDKAYIAPHDGIMEDVWFEVTIDAKNKFHVKIDKDSADYFNDFNKKKWLKETLEWAEDTDMFAISPSGGVEDLCVYDTITGEDQPHLGKRPKPKPITKSVVRKKGT